MSIYMYSCEYNDLGLFTKLDGKEEINNGKNVADEFNISNFLKLKAEQKNKNPLNDINIRKAIFYAIDRERIVNELLGKYGEVLNSLFAIDSYYYYPAWSEYDYDLNKAKEYLSKAGYGVDNPLYITIGTTSDKSEEQKQIIEDMIKEDLEKIGIKLGIFNEPSEEWYPDYVLSGNYELGVLSIKNFDGSSLNSNFSSDKLPSLATEENKNCLNFYWYKNSDADEILKKVINESDAEKRKELFQNLQDILAQDAVILPLYNKLFAIAYNNKKIKNVDFSIKNNKIFFDIENWILSNKEEESEDKINEIIIGYKGEYCKLSNLLNMDYINSLVLKGLWEINEKGEYESVLVEEEYVSYDYITTSMPTLKRKITLKDNIFWEDGTPITSGDVKYTYDAILEDGIIINIDEDYSRIEEIEIINEKEFNIVFKENVKDWKKLFSVILKDGLLEGKDINNFSVKSIISNGPYKVEECVDGEYLLLKKNEFYLGELSEIDSIKILFDTDINNLISMFIDGEVDLLEIPADLDLMKNLEEDEDFDLLVKPNNVLEHLVICLKPVEG